MAFVAGEKQKKPHPGQDVALFKTGAEGRSRTGTDEVHCPLKTACLPIPPLRHLIYCAVFPDAGISRASSTAGTVPFCSAFGMGTVNGSLLTGFRGAGASVSTLTFFMTLPVLF